MDSHPKSSPTYRFGPYEADVVAGQLRKGGARIRLAGQPFEILVMLLERAGQVVTREEIQQRLWSNETFGDFENGLNKAVNKIRQALADSAEEPRYIETLPRRGYRFIARIEAPAPPSATPGRRSTDVAAQASGSPSPSAPAEASVPRRRGIWLVLAGGILLVIIAGVRWGAHLTSRPVPRPAIRSLAVLPLEDLSHDPAQDYFAEAMTDELITSLAKIRELRVISRTSVMKYRSKTKTIGEIARELNVDAIVEGTILRSGPEVHITAQLIQANPEQHLWAESYSRPLGDLMAIEGEVVREIAGAIRLTLTPEEQSRLSSAHKVLPEAFQAYLQGRFFWNKRSPEGLLRAIEFFDQAIDKDPLYAGAYAGLADAYILRGGYFSMPESEAISRARAAARKALEIDPSLAEAHASLGLIAGNYDWDWPEAEREYRRAIELNPNYATAHHWYGEAFLALTGRFDEALAEMNRARELDPLSTIIRVDTGVVYYMARQNDAAIAQYRRALELEPSFALAHVWLSRAYAAKGMQREAIQEIEPQRQLDSSLVSLSDLGRLYGASGRREDALRVLRELRERSANGHLDPAHMINVCIGLSEKDEVFGWFEKAYAEHSVALTSLKVLPLYDPIRSDPRFSDFERRVRLLQ